MVDSVPEKILLAAPRGYCAGVDRAVQTVERALEFYGAPVYVRKEIVHNKHVVEQLRARGAVFVESEADVPEGATVVFSAHGVSPAVHAGAREHGADAHLIDNESQVRDEWLEGASVVGITSGASAPEDLVQRLVAFFRARGTGDVQELEVVQEDVRFMLPKAIRQAMAAA